MYASTVKNHHSMRNAYTPVRRPTPEAARKKTKKVAEMAGVMELDVRSLHKAALWVAGLMAVLLLFLALSFGLIKLYRHCTTSDYFNINHISVSGTHILSEEDVLMLSALREGENILVTSIPDVEKRLLNSPWVEKVSLRRELPNQFFIDIEERRAIFWVLKEEILYYVDANGNIIAPVDNSNFKSYPMLDINYGGEDALAILPRFMERISSTDLPFDLSQISWLKLSAAKGFELYWENKQLSLSIGIEDWIANLRRMNMVLEDMENREEINEIKEIRAADGQVWLQKL